MSKHVQFKSPSRERERAVADDWVATRGEPEAAPGAPVEALKRLSIDIPESLHRRLKRECASRGEKMADVIRRYLEGAFPE